MARAKKPGQHLNCKVAQKEYDVLTKICENTGLEKTTVVEHAIRLYAQMQNGYTVDSNGSIHFNQTLDEILAAEKED